MSSTSCTDPQTDCRRFESRSTDMATVPEQELSRTLPSMSLGPSQRKALDFSMTTNIRGCSKVRPGIPLYGHYNMEQPLGHWSGALAGQYSSSATPYPQPHPYPHPHHLMSEHSIHPSGYHQSNVAEWSQYSLFPYSCWRTGQKMKKDYTVRKILAWQRNKWRGTFSFMLDSDTENRQI